MLTSNVQLGYIFDKGGGQAVQDSLSCPPPRISINQPGQLAPHPSDKDNRTDR